MSKRRRSSSGSSSSSRSSYTVQEEKICIEIEPEFVEVQVTIKEEPKDEWECPEYGESEADACSAEVKIEPLRPDSPPDWAPPVQKEELPLSLRRRSLSALSTDACDAVNRVDSREPAALDATEANTIQTTNDKLDTQASLYARNVTSEQVLTALTRLEEHAQRVHNIVSPYRCEICDTTFTRLSGLKNHRRVHTGERPFKCGTCEKNFIQLGHLKRHERVHSDERPYTCGSCKKGFKLELHLKRHELIHTGERPYVCGICNKRFTQASNLKGHEPVHSGERSYPCGLCEKRFTHLSNLKRHERLHSGERPYSCGVCKQKFAQEFNLKRHERIHSSEKQCS